MDDQLSTVRPPAEAYEVDAVIEELRAEFDRLERESVQADTHAVRRAKAALDALDLAEGLHDHRMISSSLDRAFLALEAIDHAFDAFGPSSVLSRQYKYWIGVLAFCLAALAKLKALLARSLRATLRVPLFMDGPELSGYKHRLR
ncbi:MULTISPECIES: hypothetical protein [Pseudomonas]|uniref:hypothetical protein n=1 Tax=Pseudomonas TaxID=286 RepID=UPI00062B0E86|nr:MULTISPECIES: hypothetical protein [Pseudomonas]KKX58155.1 hypothetical protein PU99_25865 [Pseudomonas putida]MDD0997883.1 hypothetical protein [Pseudomonas sp. TNT2022 ID1044]